MSYKSTTYKVGTGCAVYTLNFFCFWGYVMHTIRLSKVIVGKCSVMYTVASCLNGHTIRRSFHTKLAAKLYMQSLNNLIKLVNN